MSGLAEKQQQQEYLKKLLGKHEHKGQQVQNYLKITQMSYQEKIKAGIFQIKQTSDVIAHKNHNKHSKIDSQNMKNMKQNLEKSLKIIDSRIQQLSESEKKAIKVNDEERLKFVSQMIKARKQLQKKREKKIEEKLSKQQQESLKQKQQAKKKQEQAKSKRKEDILKRAESLEAVRNRKKTEIENQNKQLKLKLEEKLLGDRMAEKYKLHEESLLEQRKKKLAEIRSIHKPLTKSQFELHLQKLDKLKSERSRVIPKQQISRYMTNDTNKFYKSKWYEKSKQEPKLYEDDKQKEELQQAKQMKDKLKKYSQYVKHNFKPEIDAKKTKQLSELNEKNKSVVQSPKTEDLREIGLKYLQWSKQHIDPNKKNSSDNEQDSNSNSKKLIKPINYLEQMKKNKKPERNPQQIIEEIKNKKNLSQSEKAQKVLEYVEALERKAKLREQKAKINHVLVDQQLDNMYMEAIQMKLSMLGRQEK